MPHPIEHYINGENVRVTTPLSLPIQASSVDRARSYFNAFEIIINNLDKSSLDSLFLTESYKQHFIKAAKTKLEEVEKRINSLSLSTPPTLDEMTAIDTLQENYSAFLVDLFMNSTLGRAAGTPNVDDVKSWLRSAENLANWRTRPPLETHYQHEGIEKTLIEKPIYRFTENLVKEYLSILPKSHHKPTWFTALPQWEQKELQSRVLKAKQAAEATGQKTSSESYQKIFAESVGTPPSTLRRYPGLANYSEHRQILKKEGEVISDTTYYRAATPTPFDIQDKTERQRLTALAIEQFKQNHPDAAQNILGFVTPISSPGVPEYSIFKDNTEAATQQDVTYASRAINKFRGFVPGETHIKKDKTTAAVVKQAIAHLNTLKTNYPDQQTLLEKVKSSLTAWHRQGTSASLSTLQQQVNEAIENIKMKKPLMLEDRNTIKFLNILSDYAELLQKSPSTGHDRNPNLWRAAYEEMILKALYGCKSNKDRAAAFTLQLDAMEEVFAKTGRLPKFNDKGALRDEFNKAYAAEFLSGHHNDYAALNASGAAALKSIRGVLPKDTQRTILKMAAYSSQAAKTRSTSHRATIFDQHKHCAARNKQSLKVKIAAPLPAPTATLRNPLKDTEKKQTTLPSAPPIPPTPPEPSTTTNPLRTSTRSNRSSQQTITTKNPLYRRTSRVITPREVLPQQNDPVHPEKSKRLVREIIIRPAPATKTTDTPPKNSPPQEPPHT